MRFVEFCRLVGLDLEPFQRKIAKAIAAAQRETVVLIPRGNGKTHLLAAIALHHLLTVEGAAVYCAAASREQARILFEAASAFARELDHPNIVDRHLELRWCPDPSKPRAFTRHLRVLAAEARLLHGLKPSLVVVDEMHSHVDDSVYVSLRTAMLKVPGSKMIVISSAGQGADSPLGRLRSRGFAQPDVVRKGAFIDARGPNLRLLEWSLPEDADIDNPKVVKTCNPASWITPELLDETSEAVPAIAFRRYHCGQWTEREGAWLAAGEWQAITGKPEFTDGEPVWLGVDIGGDRSTTAIAWVNATFQIGVWIGHGDEAVLDAKDMIRELAIRYEVRDVTYDPWRAGQLAAELERERITVTAFPQSDSRMVPASAALHAAVVERKLTVPDDAELRQQVANTIARHGRRGWRLDKTSFTEPNDSVVALAMAFSALESHPQPVELLAWI